MRDEIFKLARESGVRFNCDYPDDWLFDDEMLERFYNLAVQHEREECAKVVENYALGYAEPTWAFKLTVAIRHRSKIDSIVQNERSARGEKQ